MNETLSVFLDFDLKNADEMEDVINRMDEEVIFKEGWKYAGISNLYLAKDPRARDETIYKVMQALQSTEWLKVYKPCFFTGDAILYMPFEDVDVSGMSAPRQGKLKRYEDFYNRTGNLPHEIVLDEAGRLRDGYISYLLARKYSANVRVLSSWANKPLKKVVIGEHVYWDGKQAVQKSRRQYVWIYDLKEPVIPGDVLLVRTKKGFAHMRVSEIRYVTGTTACAMYKKVKKNETADV